MPLPDRQRLTDFEDSSKSLEFARILGPATHWWYRRCASRILSAAPKARRILDIGTGPGHLLAPLIRCYPEASIVGMDIADSMLQIARTMTAGRPVALVRGSFDSLPFRDCAFDLVTATGVLHHADDPSLLLREARRVLVPGGRLVALGFRRDATALTRALFALHTWTLQWRGSKLEGGSGVLGASWTGSEIRTALGKSGFLRFLVDELRATLVVTAIR